MRSRTHDRRRFVRVPWSSVRGRATIAATALFALTSVLAGVAFLSVLRRTMVDNVDSALEVRAADLAALVGSGVTPRELAIADEASSFAQVVVRDEVVAASANVRGLAPIVGPDTTAGRSSTFTTLADVPRSDDRLRVLSVRADSPAGPVGVIVGRTLGDVEQTVRAATLTLLPGLAVLTALAGATTWTVVGRALRPVDEMTADVASIGAGALGRRVTQPTTDDEVARLADTMNDMLERIESGTRAQRDFVAAASHELRTPIAVVRHELEVARRIGEPEWSVIVDDVLDETARMQQLVDDLLVLARVEGPGRGPATPAPLVDLDDVVVEVARRHPGVRRIELTGVEAGQVRGNPDDLRRVVRNLLDNALRHAADRVTVSVRSEAGRVVLDVDDDGPGVPDEDRQRIFDRFVRLDDARTRDAGGSGLGLAIVAESVATYSGTVDVHDSPDLGGARFRVSLPDARREAT